MHKYNSSFSSADIEIEKEEILYQGFHQFKIVYFKHKLFAGGYSQTVSREILVKNDAVAIIAYDPYMDALVMVEQVRIGAYATNSNQSPWLLELIAGVVEHGEDPYAVAIRESKEEANIELDNLTHILRVLNSPGGTKDNVDIFVAKVDSKKAKGIHGLSSENEDIKVVVLGRDEAYSLVESGVINNNLAVIGVQWLMLNYLKLKQSWNNLI